MLPENDRVVGKPTSQETDAIFADFESRSNLVGLYSLLLKIDKRVNPQLYERGRSHD